MPATDRAQELESLPRRPVGLQGVLRRAIPIVSQARQWSSICASFDRIALTGGPQVGKTTLASSVNDRPIYHSDDFKQYSWDEVPYRMIEAVAKVPRFLIEGVMVARALRKGLAADCLVVLHEPCVERNRGQVAMSKGINTILWSFKLGIPRFDFRAKMNLDAIQASD
jgi:hypothetical protein